VKNNIRADFRIAFFVMNNECREGIDQRSLAGLLPFQFDLGRLKTPAPSSTVVSSIKFGFSRFPAARDLMRQGGHPTR
jgi:hypothetical protein